MTGYFRAGNDLKAMTLNHSMRLVSGYMVLFRSGL